MIAGYRPTHHSIYTDRFFLLCRWIRTCHTDDLCTISHDYLKWRAISNTY